MDSTNFLQAAYQNENKPDGAMALVVQGGGMRGVYSMAALAALEELGFSEKFDYVVGSSAGAINGAYFIAKQAKGGTGIYTNELSVSGFISFFRLKKIVDIDFLIDLVVKNTVKLSIKRIKDISVELEISLTNAKTIKTEYLSTKKDTFDLCESLRATAALPVLYDKEVHISGENYIDGGISDYIPLNRAIEKGYKNIVVVLTSELKHRKSKVGFFRYLAFINKKDKLKKVLLQKNKNFNDIVDIIKSNHPDIKILCIAPSDKERLVSTITKNKESLLDCALMAVEDVYAKLSVDLKPTYKNFFDIWISKAQILNKK
ncbi:MAG: patatin family protein [Gammaproteobacteria bacterium]|nr:patatin family protein [Gammaproteobacteria bacterium]